MSFYQSTIGRNMAKTVVLSAIAFATTTGFTANKFANPDFAGEWKLNESKSELGQFGARMAPGKLKITADKDALSVEKTGMNPQGEAMTTTDKMTFDGKETESTIFGTSKKKSVTKWSEDGQALNTNSTIMLDMNGQTTEIKVVESWKLTNDGKSLSVEQKSTSSFGDNNMKLVYDKVQ